MPAGEAPARAGRREWLGLVTLALSSAGCDDPQGGARPASSPSVRGRDDGAGVSTDDVCGIVITAPDGAWLVSFVRRLVDGHLCAAGHLASMRTIYRWEDAVHDKGEARVALHTRASLVPAIVDRTTTAHSYALPCVVALPIMQGNPAYLDWIGASIGEPRPALAPAARRVPSADASPRTHVRHALLRRWRERAGLTQEELAARSTLSVRAIRNLEAGQVRRARPEYLRGRQPRLRADRHRRIIEPPGMEHVGLYYLARIYPRSRWRGPSGR